jgi:hypothetical protein
MFAVLNALIAFVSLAAIAVVTFGKGYRRRSSASCFSENGLGSHNALPHAY